MIDLTLSDAQDEIRATARRFAEGEMLPLIQAAARSDGHVGLAEFRGLVTAANGFGLHAMLIPEEYGGAGLGCMDNVIVHEEFGAVGVGLGGALDLNMTVPNMIAIGGTPVVGISKIIDRTAPYWPLSTVQTEAKCPSTR